jgi:hypothetical protein
LAIWKLADGNKSIVGLVLLKIIDEPGVVAFLAGWHPIVEMIVRFACGLTIAHHGAKGFFSRKKGS